ncbi:hypothetical protein [Streptomyces coeruleoprunus]|uniref:hypothetical protein n=1 Tax=Streptomyces coeruleoprunus TaxID=285563 RepID=UPI0031EC1A4B
MAVFGIVLVALTGARGSGGGSCGGSHSSSSSSNGSDSGSNGHRDDDTSTSGGSGGSVPGGGSSSNQAMRDIRIDECKLDAAGKNLVARLTIKNDGAIDYKYDATVQFKGDAGASVNTAIARVDDVLVASSGSQTTEATTPYTGTGDGSEYKKCVVISADRSMS